MRIRIDHSTVYEYERPARAIMQILRLTPRRHDGQQVLSWRLETDVDTRLRQTEDAFGNVVHVLHTERPTPGLTVRVVGEIETTDTSGMLKGTPERLPPLVYRRETALTRADAAVRELAKDVAGAVERDLPRLHALMRLIHARVVFDTDATHPRTSAAEALALGRGVCQDHAQLFISAARVLEVPARYVSGHLVRADGQTVQEAAHAWAEAHVPDLGWVGFDPANAVCPTEAYVRVATGLDYLDAAPIRGTSYGGRGERMSVKLKVQKTHAEIGMGQTQAQRGMTQQQRQVQS